jgi:hypothetical protein
MKTAQYMTRQRGVTRIDELAFHSGLSVRQYERRFAEEAGVTRSCLRVLLDLGWRSKKTSRPTAPGQESPMNFTLLIRSKVYGRWRKR